MTRRLPPLKALQAFEAAARHMSFSKAAKELCVTTAAVSQQVKSLEEYLGVRLFHRLSRALLLTGAGEAYLPEFREAFDQLTETWGRLSGLDAENILTVNATPSFADKWLVPRLVGFREANPDLEVRVFASLEPVDLTRSKADIVIRSSPCDDPGLHVERLLTEEVFPVCSPALLKGAQPLRAPAALRFHTLLHVDGNEFPSDCPNWRAWLQMADVQDVDPAPGPRYNLAGMALQAAITGQGVALGGGVLAGEDLTTGRLVKPFEYPSAVGATYYLVCPSAFAKRRIVTTFRSWLLQEAAVGARPGYGAGATVPPRPINGTPHHDRVIGESVLIANRVKKIPTREKTLIHAQAVSGSEVQESAVDASLAHVQHEIDRQPALNEVSRGAEHELRAFVEHSPVELAMLDHEMRYLIVSRRWRETTSLGDDDVRGWSHYSLFSNSPERWLDAHRRGLAGVGQRCDQDLLPRPDGGDDWFRWAIEPWRNPAGDVGGIILYSENVSARVRAELALRSRERHYRTLFDESPSLCLTVDAEGTIVSVNQFGASELGFLVHELVGIPVATVYDDDIKAVDGHLQRCLHAPEPIQRWNVRMVRKDGTQWSVVETTRGVFGSDGARSLLMVCQDATHLVDRGLTSTLINPASSA